MTKTQIEKFATLLRDEYKAEFPSINYLTDEDIIKQDVTDLAIDIVQMETELYEKFNDKRITIREIRENVYNAKGWKK